MSSDHGHGGGGGATGLLVAGGGILFVLMMGYGAGVATTNNLFGVTSGSGYVCDAIKTTAVKLPYNDGGCKTVLEVGPEGYTIVTPGNACDFFEAGVEQVRRKRIDKFTVRLSPKGQGIKNVEYVLYPKSHPMCQDKTFWPKKT